VDSSIHVWDHYFELDLNCRRIIVKPYCGRHAYWLALFSNWLALFSSPSASLDPFYVPCSSRIQSPLSALYPPRQRIMGNDSRIGCRDRRCCCLVESTMSGRTCRPKSVCVFRIEQSRAKLLKCEHTHFLLFLLTLWPSELQANTLTTLGWLSRCGDHERLYHANV
jgi:hypothetical protein